MEKLVTEIYKRGFDQKMPENYWSITHTFLIVLQLVLVISRKVTQKFSEIIFFFAQIM